MKFVTSVFKNRNKNWTFKMNNSCVQSAKRIINITKMISNVNPVLKQKEDKFYIIVKAALI